MMHNNSVTIFARNTTDIVDFECLDFDTMSVSELAVWLHHHGAAHLSAIERVELAERLTRRRFITRAGGLLGAAALAGCTQSELEPAQVAGPKRTVQHVLGTTDVPEVPRRVITCDFYFTLPTAIKLQMPVVGAPFGATQALPDWVAALAPADVTDVGTNAEPNLERMAALQPDLIIGFAFFLEPIYTEVTAIAPTVVLPHEMLNNGWKNGVRQLAEVFGQQETVEQYFRDYDQRVQVLQQAIGEEIAIKTVSLVRVLKDELRIHTKLHFGGSVLAEAGLSRPSHHTNVDDEQPVIRLTLEQIEQIDADAMFVIVGGGGRNEGASQTFETLQQNPLWQQLQAVRNGSVYPVGDHWLSGELHAANLILDDLQSNLLG
ncbi:MAG: iron-siderophore ABC transporter substrate-binding protein [Chloroflexales bacterium]|nr:iron-siderophore ABC transporter substrate-binding protein [Chloroflexales bacterium]